MIVVRDIFQIKFGRTKEATAVWKQGLAIVRKQPYGKGGSRMLTDLVGPSYYTLILESTFESVSQWEQASNIIRNDPEWKEWYKQVGPLTDGGRREILTVIE